MTKLKLLVELSYDRDSMHEDIPGGHDWFHNEVLGDPQLTMFSNHIGDTVGYLKVIGILSDLRRTGRPKGVEKKNKHRMDP